MFNPYSHPLLHILAHAQFLLLQLSLLIETPKLWIKMFISLGPKSYFTFLIHVHSP